MQFGGFHIMDMKMIHNVEIYYESDIPFPFSYATSMIREQSLLRSGGIFTRGSK